MRTHRQPAEQRLGNEARKLHRALARHKANAERARRQQWDAAADLLALWSRTCDRFGRVVPGDPMVLDVLASVEIEDGDVWRWLGPTNNHGVPSVRAGEGRQERSVARVLGLAFGVIAADEFGLLYPKPGVSPRDVNPWHRVLRASVAPVGNLHRSGVAE